MSNPTYSADTLVYWHDPDNNQFSGYYWLAESITPDTTEISLKQASPHATAIFKVPAKTVQLDPPKDNHVVDIVLPPLTEDSPVPESTRTYRRSLCVPSLLVRLFGCNSEEETYNCMLANRQYNDTGTVTVNGTTITKVRGPHNE